MKKKHKNRWHAYEDDRIEEYWEEEGLLDDDRDFDDDEADELLEFDDELELIEGPIEEPNFPDWNRARHRKSG